MGGGYVLSAAPKPTRRWWNIPAMTLAAALMAGSWVYNTSVDRANFEGGGVISAKFYNAALPYLRQPYGRLLIGYLAFGMSYDAKINIPWYRLGDDIYLKYPIPGRGGDSRGQTAGPVCFKLKPNCMYLEGPAAYRAAIRAHWFSFISLYMDHYDSVQDKVIIQTVEHTPGYVVLTRIGKSPTWIYLPDYRTFLSHLRDGA